MPGERQLKELYQEAFPNVARFVSRMGGSFHEAKDIFHDSLVIFYEKSSSGTVEIYTTPQAYLLGIAKKLWIRKFKQKTMTVSLDELEQEIMIPDDYYETPENNRLVTILERAGKKCMDLLRSFYYDKLSLKEIAVKNEYSTIRSATAQKFKCLEKVRDIVKQKSITYDDLA